MNGLNVLFSLYSLTAVVISIERLLPSPYVPPYNFIRLHELNQTIMFIGATVVLSVLYLKHITKNFGTLTKKTDALLLLIFICGTYLYGAGEGWHEVASFTLNTYCKPVAGNLCNGLFINDYYAGNIMFFVGGIMMSVPLLLLSYRYPEKPLGKGDMAVLLGNSFIFACTWFAYAAFDKVLVGLMFSMILMGISLRFAVRIRGRFAQYPFITYSAVAYTLASAAALVVRLA